jgi:hypothetical protein
MSRRLRKPFGETETLETFSPEYRKRAVLCHRFIKSQFWSEFQEIVEEIKSAYTAPVPAGSQALPLLCGYFTYSIIRDGLNHLLTYISGMAADGGKWDEGETVNVG